MNLKYVAECQLLMGIKGLAWVNKEKQRVENQDLISSNISQNNMESVLN